jgi:tRNA threonylcarbamoyladenosine biosynthesis protein TsaB
MLVLALDTTTRQGSCALVRGPDVLLERMSDASQPPASRLPGELMTLVAAAGVTLLDVDIYAVATGPGSFTGLRVGIAAMQGLAFAAGKPLIGVSAFDALAELTREPAGARLIAPWVDAWRGEVYAAVYQDGAQVDPPVVTHPDRLLERLQGHSVAFVGDGAAAYRERILAASGIDAVLVDPLTPPLAATIARLAAAAAAGGELPPPHAIRPLYVRRSDPELARDARLAG